MKPLTLDEARKLGLIGGKPTPKRKTPPLLIGPLAHVDLNAREIVLRVPLKLESEANRRGQWFVHDARRKKQRVSVRALFSVLPRGLRLPFFGVFVVTITRIAPRFLDTDNLASSAKAVRDEVASCLGVSDGPHGLVRWEYSQESEGKLYGCEIKITWEVRQ